MSAIAFFRTEQNSESADRCLKSIVRKNNDKFGKKIGLNK